MPRLTVSFCIPIHDRLLYLREALESGLAQSRLPDEIVVSDDLGKEETRSLVADFSRKAAIPVRYVRCLSGQSLADNINNCLREAACDLVLLLHDDDLITPRAVELLALPFEENEHVVASYGKQIVIDDGGEEDMAASGRLNRSYFRDEAHAGLQPDAFISGITQQFPNDGYMVKTSAAREVLHKAEYEAGSEVDFGIRLGEQGLFYFVNEHTAKYRLSRESIGRGKASQKSDSCAYHTMRIFLGLLDTHPHHEVELVSRLKAISPISISMAANTGRVPEATSWYFGPYHRQKIFTKGGLRRGLLLSGAWLRRLAAPKCHL